MDNASIERYEVLARVIDDNGNIICDTQEFVNNCHKLKCIDRVDKIVFETAMLRFSEQNTTTPVLMVNFSKDTIMSPDCLNFVRITAKKYNFPLGNIIIEITESDRVDDFKTFIQQMNNIHAMGIKIALDDYGVGYTSIDYLIKLPLDYLKLDRDIAVAAVHDERSLHVVNNIIQLTTSMNVELIVEGIEDLKTYRLYRSLGVRHMQGYFFSKPLTYTDIVDFLKK